MPTRISGPGVKVGTLLRTFVAVLTALMLTLAGVTLFTVYSQSQHVQQLTRYLSPAFDANRSALQSLTDAQTYKRRYLGTLDATAKRDYQASIAAYSKQLDVTEGLLKSDPNLSGSSSGWTTRLKAERSAGKLWLAFSETQFVESDKGNSVDLFPPHGLPLFQSFRSANADLDNWIRTRRDVLRVESQQALPRQLILISLTTLMCLVIALWIALRISRVLVTPLTLLRETVSRQRNGDAAARADEGFGAREVRMLAADFNALSVKNYSLTETQGRELELNELTRTIDRFIRSIEDIKDINPSLDRLSRLLGTGLDIDRVIVQVLEGPFLLAFRGQWAREGLPPSPWTLPERIASIREFVEHLWARGNIHIIRDFDDEEHRENVEAQRLRKETGFRTVVLIPVGLGDETWGLIMAGSVTEPHSWTHAETDAIQRSAICTAGLVGSATHNAHQREYIDKLEVLDRQKTDFLSTVSHELRTPLTSISGYLELLKDGDAGDLNDRQRKMLDVIGRNSIRLQGLIEDLLVLNRIESGGLKINSSLVDITTLIEFAVEELRPLADSAGITVRTDAPPGRVKVNGDPTHLQRAFINVLANAIKFSLDAGQVDITLTTGESAAVVSFADHGIGIPEADRSQLFTKFFRAGNAQEKVIPGTGLGLVIVKQIIEDHGGTVELTSEEGIGTTVTMRLPLA